MAAAPPTWVSRPISGGLLNAHTDQPSCPRDPHGNAVYLGSTSTEVTRALAGIVPSGPSPPCLFDMHHPVEPIDPGAVPRIE